MDEYLDNGLLQFKSIKNSELQIITTFDNSVWGNMNPYYSKTDEDKERINQNDKKLFQYVSAKKAFVFTTPPEDTFIHFEKSSYDYYLQFNKDEFINIRANAGIITKQKEKYSYIFAPSDCPILVLQGEDIESLLLIHLGAPQVMQKLHIKIINYFKSVNSIKDFSKFTAYLTPYICKSHYSISEEKYLKYKELLPEEILEKYLKRDFNKIYQTERYYFDFVGLAKEQMRELFGLTNIIESKYCTYEEAEKGNLFSHELSQEKDESKDPETDKYKGSYNVIVSI